MLILSEFTSDLKCTYSVYFILVSKILSHKNLQGNDFFYNLNFTVQFNCMGHLICNFPDISRSSACKEENTMHIQHAYLNVL